MDIKIPEVGESIIEATIAKWHKKEGDRVVKDDLLCEVETDKITLEIRAEADGVLSIKAEEGKTLKVGTVIAVLQEGADSRKAAGESKPEASAPKPPTTETKQAAPAKEPPKAKAEKPVPAPAKAAETTAVKSPSPRPPAKAETEAPPTTPPSPEKTEQSAAAAADERITRKPMSAIRRKIAERLLAARQQTAMVTTFNEADMSRIVELRQRYRGSFKARHGVKLGLLPFFLKACAEALQEFPELNARIDGEDIVYQHFYDIGIAVAAEKGLLVPVIRDVTGKDFAELSKIIEDFSARAKVSRIELSELEGGTFSITNGGTYGSLLSTPILNPPQSAILGLHAIQERPVARAGQVVIRPMMNLALSYDHRLVDGQQAVEFLVRIKTLIEEPEEMLLEL